jgi:hypothetical protein
VTAGDHEAVPSKCLLGVTGLAWLASVDYASCLGMLTYLGRKARGNGEPAPGHEMTVTSSMFLAVHAWAVGEWQRNQQERVVCARLLRRLLDTLLTKVTGVTGVAAVTEFQVTVPSLRPDMALVVLTVRAGIVDARACFDGADRQLELYESWRQYSVDPSLQGLMSGNVCQCPVSELLAFCLLRGNAAHERCTVDLAFALVRGICPVLEAVTGSHALRDLRPGRQSPHTNSRQSQEEHSVVLGPKRASHGGPRDPQHKTDGPPRKTRSSPAKGTAAPGKRPRFHAKGTAVPHT